MATIITDQKGERLLVVSNRNGGVISGVLQGVKLGDKPSRTLAVDEQSTSGQGYQYQQECHPDSPALRRNPGRSPQAQRKDGKVQMRRVDVDAAPELVVQMEQHIH